MGVQVRTIKNSSSMTVENLGNQLADWLLQDHNFSVKRKGWQDNKYAVSVNKSSFLRQISGLVFEYKIELSKTDNSIVATVEDGDIRKQLAALGLAWFVAWPLLVTAGFGMYSSGEFREEIFSKIESMLNLNLQNTQDTDSEISRSSSSQSTTLIDINNGSEQELSALPGLTSLQIKQLIKSRETRRGFKSIEEMGEMLGLKPHILLQIRPLVKFSPIKIRSRLDSAHAGGGRVVDY